MSKAISIDVIYSDDDLVIANKPAGITVIPERNHPERDTVQTLLEKQFGRLWVVHRIDKFTSGVLCFARNEAAHRHISLQFQNHEVQKTYTAVVQGRLNEPEGVIDAPIAESQTKPGTMLIHARGKSAVSIYKVQQQFRHAAVVSIEIKTGRTHQIRVHMAYIGHPLLVDEVYGKTEAFYFSTIKRNYKPSGEEERPTIARLTLHAASLQLTHPVRHTILLAEAPLPKDLDTLIKLLSKYDS
ncbi:MAG: RluA family pseudouridine synthase [Bacteroidetes bacterium]|nr:RluA family pseudouridine synthase [Bacteroidota bacterium]